MKNKIVLTYATTLLLSAALLFVIQPMFGKMVLPVLGGAPAVWNTLMVFFQAMLLAGYAYAHLTSRYLSLRLQTVLHMTLLVLCLLTLPITIPEGWSPPQNENPSLWILALASISVGAPFLVLAGNAPMLQYWFSKTDHPDAQNPYFLYAASNLGSLAVLLLYPILFEPLWGLRQQSYIWTGGFILLIIAIGFSALLSAKTSAGHTGKTHDTSHSPTWEKRLMWIVLAFVPSSLMLGVTLHVTTDIASVPLLWVIPLALYLLTFVIVFAKKTILNYKQVLNLHAVTVIGFIFFMMSSPSHPGLFITVHFFVFFISALMCHQELSLSKPDAHHLTEFYFWMSLGGVLGGTFNALLAPILFNDTIEYFLVLILACTLRNSAQLINKGKVLTTLSSLPETAISTLGRLKKESIEPLLALFFIFTGCLFFSQGAPHHYSFGFIALGCVLALRHASIFSLGLCLIFLTLYNYTPAKHDINSTLFQQRNFFGVMSVGNNTKQNLRHFYHGTTLHGVQSLNPKETLAPLGYYHSKSPLADAFEEMDRRSISSQHVAVIGLGVGATVCYGSPNRKFTFFEIDPGVVKVAENSELFSFLKNCGTPYDIVLGDGRRSLQNVPDKTYDMIFIDAFTSDNIPIHLITKEAIVLYLKKLKPGGFILIHISNRFLNLEKPLSAIANTLNLAAYAKFSQGLEERDNFHRMTSHFLVLAKTKENLASLAFKTGWRPAVNPDNIGAWTDNYSNIISNLWSKQDLEFLKKENKQHEKK